jgi:hypothetical protein
LYGDYFVYIIALADLLGGFLGSFLKKITRGIYPTVTAIAYSKSKL